jgi:hypothetical protein
LAKQHIVRLLAVYQRPSDVAAEIRSEFGITITRQTVAKYNPATRSGAKLSSELREVYRQTRETFKKDLDSIAFAQRPARLQTLQRLAEKAESAGDLRLAHDCVETAAKEMGGIFNRSHAMQVAEPHVPRTLADFYARPKDKKCLQGLAADADCGAAVEADPAARH